MIAVAHQRRSRKLAGDLSGRAAHVDVDDFSAQRRCNARTLRHPAGIAAGKLYDKGFELGTLRARTHAMAIAGEVLARNHFRNNQSRTERSDRPAEGQIGYAGHGREQDRVRHHMGPDPQR
jgi:hypothetical protein